MTDLWPEDIQIVKEKAPVTILREQASLLGQRTKNVVTAEVRPEEDPYGGDFSFVFYIVGPALGNYRYRLFQIRHGIELYPAEIWLPNMASVKEAFPWVTSAPPRVKAKSEEEFQDFLGRVFRSQKTRQVIQAILAQSGVEPGERS